MNQRFQRRSYQGNRNQDGNSHRQFFGNNSQTLSRGRTHANNPHQLRGHPHSRFNYRPNTNLQHQYYMHEQQQEQYGPHAVYVAGTIILLKHCYKGEHDINNIMEKMSINPHQQNQGTLYQ